MQTEESSELFSREALAGYDREVMDSAVILLVGAGAGANNQDLNYALTGVCEVRFVDYDFVERSNATRSPCFRREVERCAKKRWKARELAERFLELSYARRPVARHAVARIEALGLAAFRGATVVVSAVDSFAVRGYLADVCRLLGIPFIESGFSGSEGHITVFRNADPDEPCWRCLHPRTEQKGLSCTSYAERVVQDGRVPATQPLAALWGAMVSEAAIQAAHGNFPLGGKVFHLDIRSAESRLSQIGRNPDCRGVHRLREIHDINVGVNESASKLLERVRAFASEPVVHLPFPFTVDAPCARCGSAVPLRRPSYAIGEDPPRCMPDCRPARKASEGALTLTQITPTDEFAPWSLRKLGMAPGTIVQIEDMATGVLHLVRLAGGPDDVFVTRRRAERNTGACGTMDAHETAAEPAAKE